MCDTYFYKPREISHQNLLSQFASKNKQSTAELLFEFFKYFAWEFDYRKSVVSIRRGFPISKLSKIEEDCWLNHHRLSIEDPFEPWYDVAHVVKSSQMKLIRNEFVRAYTLIARSIQGRPGSASTPDALSAAGGTDLLDLLLEEGNAEFELRNEEKRARALSEI